MAAGIDERRRGDGKTAFQAHVFDKRTGKRIRKTFPTKTAAKQWRTDAIAALRAGTLAEAKPKTTVREACEAWLQDARRGLILTGSPPAKYKPGTLRRYEQALRLRIYPGLGDEPFYLLRRVQVQRHMNGLAADGVSPATLAVTLATLGAVYARGVRDVELKASPTRGVEVEAARNGRERFATREEASQLLAAVPDRDRGVWAVAMYAGLRRGEAMALRWSDIDLKGGVIHVQRSWDPETGPGDTKNRNRRKVPVVGLLREYFTPERQLAAIGGELCFGIGDGRPFRPDRLQQRADDAWKEARLKRLTLHDCRHTAASLMIAAGVNAKSLSTYLGHASIVETYDRYGHLMPGNETEAAGLMDDYLTREATG